jgi:hypothetical protein
LKKPTYSELLEVLRDGLCLSGWRADTKLEQGFFIDDFEDWRKQAEEVVGKVDKGELR